MKVLHIVSGELSSGAARGAYWLHKALNENAVDSMIFTNGTNSHEKNIINTSQTFKAKLYNYIRGQLDIIVSKIYKKRKKLLFSSGLFGLDFTKTQAYQKADIIHLHWINSGFVNIKHLSKIDKPIVWTMRDMWPMTGGCHYSLECDAYKNGCGNCPQLRSQNHFDLSSFILHRKKKYLPTNMTIVGISHWLSNEAKQSLLFRDFDIKTILNNININDFFPIEKKIARKILNISTSKKIILVGATSLEDFYKGFSKYLEALKQLDSEKYFLCFFGNLDKSVVDELGYEHKIFGYLNDNISLRLVYSCADVFVAPSLMDAFGKTLAESMACETPVVCFDTTGPKDIVTHKVDGYKAKAFNIEDLSDGIEWIINNKKYNELCINAREKVVREFDSKVVASRYMQLYKEILDD